MSERVAVSVREPAGESFTLDPRFGRAGAFYVKSDGAPELVANPGRDAAGGAGPAAAAAINDAGATAVISGHFGPKALRALKGFGISAWCANEGVDPVEALRLLRAGELTQAEEGTP